MNEVEQNNRQEEAKKQISQFLNKSNWPLYVLLLACFFSWTAWGMVLNKVSPFATPSLAIPLFYVTFFFSVFTSLALFGTLFRMAFISLSSVGSAANKAVRQGIILGVVVTVALIFQDFRVLTWWDAGLLLIMGILVEFSFSESQ